MMHYKWTATTATEAPSASPSEAPTEAPTASQVAAPCGDSPCGALAYNCGAYCNNNAHCNNCYCKCGYNYDADGMYYCCHGQCSPPYNAMYPKGGRCGYDGCGGCCGTTEGKCSEYCDDIGSPPDEPCE